MTVLLAGFLLGMRHALDADHLAALSVLLVERPSAKRALVQGMAWGVGHSLTLLVSGLLVLALEIQISESLANYLELAVGLMLIVLGIDLVRRLRKRPSGAHEPVQSTSGPGRALTIGLVHGLAGSSALILLTLSTLSTKTLALNYILLFGAGSILGMALLSLAIAVPLKSASRRVLWAPAATRIAASVASIGIGVVVVTQAANAL